MIVLHTIYTNKGRYELWFIDVNRIVWVLRRNKREFQKN